GSNYSNIARVSININDINDAPIANDDYYSIDEDSILSLDILANDYDVDSNLTYKIVEQPKNGIIEDDRYIPNTNYYGVDSFTYQAYDGSNYSNIARVSININDVIDVRIFNVKDYGAIGNGVNDDTQAVRNAIEDARIYIETNNKEATIYFPQGTYKIKNFKVYSNMILKGDGISLTKLVRFVDRNAPYSTYDDDPNDDVAITTNLYNSGTFIPIPSSFGNHPSQGSYIWFRSFITNYDFVNGNSNISIYNMTINNNGYAFTLTNNTRANDAQKYAENTHHYTIGFKFVNNVKIDNVRIEDGMNWMISLRACDNVYINYVEIDGNTKRNEGRVNDRMNQDGLNLASSRNVFINKVIVFESYDSNLALEASDSNGPVYNVTINYLELHRHISDGYGVSMVSSKNNDVHDVYIKEIKIYGLDSNNRSQRKSFIKIGYPYFHETGGSTGNSNVYNIRIDKITSIGYSSNLLPYDIQTNVNRTAGAGSSVLEIDSRPTSIYTSPPNNNGKVYNVYIGQVDINYAMQGLTGEPYHGQFGVRIIGAEDVTIESLKLTNKSAKYIPDLQIWNSNNININNLYIQRLDTGGASIIEVDDSNNILLDNVRIPLTVSNEKHGNSGLRVVDNSRDILLRYIEYQVREQLKLVNIPEANTAIIRVESI
ncbi:MAG: Ig-like domain-containing protein, partial [Candidatus Nitrosocaldus sp.]